MENNQMFKEPLKVGKLMLRNRIVLPPMATGKSVNGEPTEELVGYYRERAKGTALVIVEHEYILRQGIANPRQLSMADDSVIPAYCRLTDAVHEEGAKIIAQINHAGVKARETGLPHVGPSAVAFQGGEIPVALDRDGIRAIIEAFANELVNNKDKEYQFLSLVGSDIISRYVGDAEKIVTRMFEEAENCAPCILFIDEIHTIVGAGGAEDAIDASNILKPYLARGDIKLIGATTKSEYSKFLEWSFITTKFRSLIKLDG